MPTSLNDIKTLDRRAVQHSVELIDMVTTDKMVTTGKLALPTPCAEWTLGDLIAHMTAQHRGFAAAAAGTGRDLANWEVTPSAEDPVPRYRDAADHVLANFAAVATADQEFALPEFSRAQAFPAGQAIGFHFIDYVVHSWDVARALGVPFDPEPDLLEAALPVALAVPGGASRLEPGAAFRPSLTTTDGAAILDRILAALGRSPDWPDIR